MPENALATLAAYLDRHPTVRTYKVAFSGGMDSHVLLSLLVTLRNQRRELDISAVHVDHGLHPDSAKWARHCRLVCDAMTVPLTVESVEIGEASRVNGIEAAARDARYRVFDTVLKPGEHLLLAQHADDQAETFLLQALRGAGPGGLSGIPWKRHFQKGFIARPLLSLSLSQLQEEAKRQQLIWINDPSNRDLSLDRNYLRQRVIPELRERWPSLERTLGRAASRCAAASQHADDCARADLARLTPSDAASVHLPIDELVEMSRERRYAVLRAWLRSKGQRMPRLIDLEEVSRSIIDASEGSAGQVKVGESVFRRYRNQLHFMVNDEPSEAYELNWQPSQADSLTIPATGQTIHREWLERNGLLVHESLQLVVRSRRGGELMRLGQPSFHKAVKKLLQEASLPPWERDRIPLIYCQERLIAVWGLAVASDIATAGSVSALTD